MPLQYVEADGDDAASTRPVSTTWTRPLGSAGGGWCGGSVNQTLPSAVAVRSFGREEGPSSLETSTTYSTAPSGATCCNPGVIGAYGGGSSYRPTTGEVDPAVLGDEEPAVACEERGVRTSADDGDAWTRAGGQVDALDSAAATDGHAREHECAVRAAPHRPFREVEAVATTSGCIDGNLGGERRGARIASDRILARSLRRIVSIAPQRADQWSRATS